MVLPGILKIDLNKRKQHSVGGNNNDKRHKRVISNSQWFFALRIIRLLQVRHREALRFTGPNDQPAAPVGALIPIKSVLNANGPSRAPCDPPCAGAEHRSFQFLQAQSGREHLALPLRRQLKIPDQLPLTVRHRHPTLQLRQQQLHIGQGLGNHRMEWSGLRPAS